MSKKVVEKKVELVGITEEESGMFNYEEEKPADTPLADDMSQLAVMRAMFSREKGATIKEVVAELTKRFPKKNPEAMKRTCYVQLNWHLPAPRGKYRVIHSGTTYKIVKIEDKK